MDNIGILDPEGINLNPITNEPYSDKYREVSVGPSNNFKPWAQYPLYRDHDPKKIIKDLQDHQVTVVMAGTGTGKTVIIPKLMLHAFGYQRRVVVTEPRQTPTKNHGEYAAIALDVKLGEEVGYKFRGSGSNVYNRQKSLLSFVTDGTLIAEFSNDELLSHYDAVIIDEAHERSVNIDLLLLMLKKPLEERPEFRVAIISATIDPHIFTNYYQDFSHKIIVAGSETSHPVEDIFLRHDIHQTDYIKKGIEIIKHIMETDNLEEPGPHDILFFVTSNPETVEVCTKIQQQFKTLFCAELSAKTLSDKEYNDYVTSAIAYKETGKTRRILVSTNVAESAVTIGGLKFVIDGGYELKNTFNPVTNASVLDRQYISRAQVTQRRGRVGRSSPGVCYYLYTKYTFERQMAEFPKTSISTTNLYTQALQLISRSSIQTTDKLIQILQDLIEPPSNLYIMSAINQLMILELIGKEEIKPLGAMIARTGLDPMAGLTLMVAYIIGCFEEVAIITTLIEEGSKNIGTIMKEPRATKDKEQTKKLKASFDRAKRKLSHRYGDHLSLLKIFHMYMESENRPAFAKEHFLRTKPLEKTKKRYKQIMRDAHTIFRGEFGGVKRVQLGRDDRIMLAFSFGYRLNIAKRSRKGYATEVVDTASISQDSFLTRQPEEVVYEELFKRSGRFSLNIVSSIPSEVKVYLREF
jgi:pre-mRNA-splicing factor ATP-dependent RNA helicase DHX15/PRP43